jgi:hypothetical protein
MTVTQMMDTLAAAIADAEAHPSSRFKRRRERAVILRLTALRVLGQQGVPSGADDNGRPMFGYTLRQCRAVLAEIEAAARADYEAAMDEGGR